MNFLLSITPPYLYCYQFLVFPPCFFCVLFLAFDFIGFSSALTRDGLLAKAIISSDLPKKMYLHVLVHSMVAVSPPADEELLPGLWCQNLSRTRKSLRLND